MVNDELTSSTYSLSNFSLPSIVLTGTDIVKVWTSKGMISKLVLPFSGLIGLIIGYTINGVTRILPFVPIFTNTKLGGSYLKSRKVVQ
jgi:hypothetical protein